MARPEPRPAYALAPADAAWSFAFLREVGETLVHGPRGAGLLVERVEDGRATLFVPSDDWVGSVLRCAAERIPVGLALCDPPPPAEPPGVGEARVGFLLPPAPAAGPGRPARCADRGEGNVGSPGPTGLAPLAPDLPEGLGAVETGSPGTWAATQTHWFARADGQLSVWSRFLVEAAAPGVDAEAWRVGVALARRVECGATAPARVRLRRPSERDRREWSGGALRRLRAGPPFRLVPAAAALVGETGAPAPDSPGLVSDLHAVVIGASGSGKTGLLAETARAWISAGRSAVVLDLHGDLAPALVGRLDPAARARVFAVDAAGPSHRIPGVALLDGRAGAQSDREVAHVVAALRRISGNGDEAFWGPRLERIFDSLVRAAQEEGGGLLDVHALLTDPRRREASRLSTRVAEVARFLDELPSLLRRNPEFLWPAAARTSKLALDGRLARLLSPGESACDVEALLADGRSVLWRLPLGDLGPEGAQLAANLLLAHVYLRRTATDAGRFERPPLLLVLDEAHLFAASLLTEILAEGRKFGVRAVLATQYPERLPTAARGAAAGAVGTHLVFRVPAPVAASLGAWVGLDRDDAVRLLPALPPGVAVVAAHGASPARRLLRVVRPSVPDPHAWPARVAASAADLPEGEEAPRREMAEADEELLLDLLARGRMAGSPERNGGSARGIPGATSDGVTDPLDRLGALERRGWVARDGGRWDVTLAGLAGLGLTTATGAANESAEHRALLVRAFLVFARRGVRMEIVRQGRFDTRLPDGRVELLPRAGGPGSPREIGERIDRARASWAWRAFGGRNLHVEVEVSGADRAERIRRDVAKARSGGAYLVVVVGRAERARRVRAVLERLAVGRAEAQVWTIPPWGGGPRGG